MWYVNQKLRGDVKNIVLKSIRDPTQRYKVIIKKLTYAGEMHSSYVLVQSITQNIVTNIKINCKLKCNHLELCAVKTALEMSKYLT